MSDLSKAIIVVILITLISFHYLLSERKNKYSSSAQNSTYLFVIYLLSAVFVGFMKHSISNLNIKSYVVLYCVFITSPIACFVSYKKWKITKDSQYVVTFLVCLIILLSTVSFLIKFHHFL